MKKFISLSIALFIIFLLPVNEGHSKKNSLIKAYLRDKLSPSVLINGRKIKITKWQRLKNNSIKILQFTTLENRRYRTGASWTDKLPKLYVNRTFTAMVYSYRPGGYKKTKDGYKYFHSIFWIKPDKSFF